MKVLVTGGAGFIGSTVVSACLDAGHDALVLDDFGTGARAFVTGRTCYDGDIADRALLDTIFREHPDIAAVVHCAALIVVPESVAEPLRYYANNVGKTIALLDHVQRVGCTRVLFSSSASIYAAGPDLSVDENSPLDPSSPYAASKAMAERVLQDVCATGAMSGLSLRYFNPVGADPQRRTGLQNAAPTHAVGKLIEAYLTGTAFTVTGTDWPTRDGSAIRDYIHVWDLARAHVHALERFDAITAAAGGYDVINVGTGQGTTVRELVTAVEAALGCRLDLREGPRRPGDVVGSFTRNDKALRLLDWTPQHSLLDAVRDALAWAQVRESVLEGG